MNYSHALGAYPVLYGKYFSKISEDEGENISAVMLAESIFTNRKVRLVPHTRYGASGIELRVLAQRLRARLRLYPRKSIKVAME